MTESKRFLRGVIHCHSRFSYDSLIPINAYLRFAERHSLDFIVLTDHDTIAGSVALREAAARRLPSLQVPIAAEYNTDEGDVIVVFLEKEINERTYSEFKASARSQNALLLLPHPFLAHRSPELLAADCDVIEVFNSRSKPADNKKAHELAVRQRKATFAGSDAHLYRSLGNAILELEDLGDLRDSILNGERRWPRLFPTSKWGIGISQLIKGWKLRDPKLGLRMVIGGFRAMLKHLFRFDRVS